MESKYFYNVWAFFSLSPWSLAQYFNPEHPSFSPSTSVFTLHFKFCCVIREWSSDFNPSSCLQPWIGNIHQRYTAGASLGEELTGISYLGAGDCGLRGLIAFKICHMPSYGWAMITKIVHQLKLLQLSRFENQSPTMARAITIY